MSKNLMIVVLTLVSSLAAAGAQAGAWRECKDAQDVARCLSDKIDEASTQYNIALQGLDRCMGNSSSPEGGIEDQMLNAQDQAGQKTCEYLGGLVGGHNSETYKNSKTACIVDSTRSTTAFLLAALKDNSCD